MTNVAIINLVFGLYVLAAVVYAAFLLLRSKGVWLAGLGLLSLGALAHLAAVIVRWVEAGHPPFTNLYESFICFSLMTALVYVGLELKYRPRKLGLFACLLAIGGLAYAKRLDPAIPPLIPVLNSRWLTVHVVVYFTAYAALGISFIAWVGYLVTTRKSSQETSENDRSELMESIGHQTIVVAFPLLTLGLITGAVWAERAWGRYWGWDPKETWALITWIVYAFYLHMRYIKGWRGRRMAWIAAVGFAVAMFTFLGLKYLPVSEQSVHIYGG
jgi:cytochrome c-type biogenesis protein CcsB